MSATSIFYNGRVIRTPGSYSNVDASGLESVGLTATGIVAILGTAEGGIPVNAVTDATELPRFVSAEKMQAAFRSGQLREAANPVFAPSNDTNILGGAQQVVALKVNPATQSTASLVASGLAQIDLTSRDYGAFTEQINVDIQTGTSKGKLLTVRFEDVVESVDNLGGDPMFTLQYIPGSYGYDTAVGAVNDGGDISITATRAGLGKSTDIANPVTNTAAEIIGANQTGSAATITAVTAAGVATIGGLTGMTAAHADGFRNITLGGFAQAGNNGTFQIVEYVSASVVKVRNPAAVFPDANSGSGTWTVSDAGLLVTLYGLAAGVPVKETLTHAGTGVVPSSTVWDAAGLLAVVVNRAPVAGTITVRIVSAGATVFTVAAGQISKGAIVCTDCHVDNTTVSIALDAGGVHTVLLFGRNNAGADVKESLTTAGVTPVVSVASTYALLDVIVVGNVAAARTLTLTARAARALNSVQGTLQKVKTYFDTKKRAVTGGFRGFVFTYGTGRTDFNTADLDVTSNKNVRDPATGSFTADLNAIVQWFNQQSQLVSAEVAVGALTIPDNTASPVFLSGGEEGVATFEDYQRAYNLLKHLRVNSVANMSGDPAVNAAQDAHCAYMCGIGRSERDAFAPLRNATMDGLPSKTEIKAQIVDLNSRHTRAFAQNVERFNSAGERTTFGPEMEAIVAMGMQAGSPVGTSLTYKFGNVLGVKQHPSWNPTDDSEEMIEAGLCFMQNVEGVGRRWVRNITTHLSTSNIAYVEGSVNAAVNFATYNFRTAMEIAVGQPGFAGTLAASNAVARGTLGQLVDEDVITSYRALTLSLALDVLDVSVEMAPIVPINFVKNNIHLTNLSQQAA